jgi:Transcriptional activator TraM
MSDGSSLDMGIDSDLDNRSNGLKMDGTCISKEAIIRAVAVKHGIALGKNDPILVLETVNGLLMEEFGRKQDVLIEEFHIKLEAAADLWSENMASEASEMLVNMENSHLQLINELVETQVKDIAIAIADNSGEITLTQQQRAAKHLRSLNSQLKTLRSMLYVNFAASIMALISAIVMLLLSI